MLASVGQYQLMATDCSMFPANRVCPLFPGHVFLANVLQRRA